MSACAICLEGLLAGGRLAALECGHVLHVECVRLLFTPGGSRAAQSAARCPLCRVATHGCLPLFLHGSESSQQRETGREPSLPALSISSQHELSDEILLPSFTSEFARREEALVKQVQSLSLEIVTLKTRMETEAARSLSALADARGLAEHARRRASEHEAALRQSQAALRAAENRRADLEAQLAALRTVQVGARVQALLEAGAAPTPAAGPEAARLEAAVAALGREADERDAELQRTRVALEQAQREIQKLRMAKGESRVAFGVDTPMNNLQAERKPSKVSDGRNHKRIADRSPSDLTSENGIALPKKSKVDENSTDNGNLLKSPNMDASILENAARSSRSALGGLFSLDASVVVVSAPGEAVCRRPAVIPDAVCARLPAPPPCRAAGVLPPSFFPRKSGGAKGASKK